MLSNEVIMQLQGVLRDEGIAGMLDYLQTNELNPKNFTELGGIMLSEPVLPLFLAYCSGLNSFALARLIHAQSLSIEDLSQTMMSTSSPPQMAVSGQNLIFFRPAGSLLH